MIYLQPITFWAILREKGEHETEIAEHSDGAMKAYATKWLANEALKLMEGDWRVDEILMVPPPRTAEYKRQQLREELRQEWRADLRARGGTAS